MSLRGHCHVDHDYAINPVTGQTLVNGTTAGDQFDAVVTTADGGAAVFYINGTIVDGRLLDANGSPVGGPVKDNKGVVKPKEGEKAADEMLETMDW